METLTVWGEREGIETDGLTPVPARRSFVAARDLPAGSTVVRVPQKCLLYAPHPQHDHAPHFRQLLSQGAQDEATGSSGPGDPRHVLCVLLILERARGEESKWAPYLNILPGSHDDPFWWQEDQVQLLRGTRLGRAVNPENSGISSIMRLVQHLESLITHGRPPGSPPSVLASYRGGWALTVEAARWARSVVWSRAFTVPHVEGSPPNTVALVPVLDMIDHDPHVEVIWHTGVDGCSDFQFVSLTPFAKVCSSME
ncbi:hypothetical protein DUNSADRAFT_3331 [Dunaliella salina]|uniref:SET domain-containing protein n=1 Tax=Dunaliella salina TaxID=3046 RepID=A0ABQ7GU49_DUNSA|nr:hypothetical protein DUNSADRAFT_3331 [Dunaliella salina]|eukprot:KAF5838136.1 hypothetical protein DUNSADRAFT_3331 [Dunaliella salina]